MNNDESYGSNPNPELSVSFLLVHVLALVPRAFKR